MAAAEGNRAFITRTQVEDAAAAGASLHLRPRDVVTDEAAQRARDLGVTLVREDRPAAPAVHGSGGTAAPAARGSGAVPPEVLRAAVRTAVVAELGHEPAGLDAALDRVLASRP